MHLTYVQEVKDDRGNVYRDGFLISSVKTKFHLNRRDSYHLKFRGKKFPGETITIDDHKVGFVSHKNFPEFVEAKPELFTKIDTGGNLFLMRFAKKSLQTSGVILAKSALEKMEGLSLKDAALGWAPSDNPSKENWHFVKQTPDTKKLENILSKIKYHDQYCESKGVAFFDGQNLVLHPAEEAEEVKLLAEKVYFLKPFEEEGSLKILGFNQGNQKILENGDVEGLENLFKGISGFLGAWSSEDLGYHRHGHLTKRSNATTLNRRTSSSLAFRINDQLILIDWKNPDYVGPSLVSKNVGDSYTFREGFEIPQKLKNDPILEKYSKTSPEAKDQLKKLNWATLDVTEMGSGVEKRTGIAKEDLILRPGTLPGTIKVLYFLTRKKDDDALVQPLGFSNTYSFESNKTEFIENGETYTRNYQTFDVTPDVLVKFEFNSGIKFTQKSPKNDPYKHIYFKGAADYSIKYSLSNNDVFLNHDDLFLQASSALSAKKRKEEIVFKKPKLDLIKDVELDPEVTTQAVSEVDGDLELSIRKLRFATKTISAFVKQNIVKRHPLSRLILARNNPFVRRYGKISMSLHQQMLTTVGELQQDSIFLGLSKSGRENLLQDAIRHWKMRFSPLDLGDLQFSIDRWLKYTGQIEIYIKRILKKLYPIVRSVAPSNGKRYEGVRCFFYFYTHLLIMIYAAPWAAWYLLYKREVPSESKTPESYFGAISASVDFFRDPSIAMYFRESRKTLRIMENVLDDFDVNNWNEEALLDPSQERKVLRVYERHLARIFKL